MPKVSEEIILKREAYFLENEKKYPKTPRQWAGWLLLRKARRCKDLSWPIFVNSETRKAAVEIIYNLDRTVVSKPKEKKL